MGRVFDSWHLTILETQLKQLTQFISLAQLSTHVPSCPFHFLVTLWSLRYLHGRIFWRAGIVVWLTKWSVTRAKPSSNTVYYSLSASCAYSSWSLSGYFTAGVLRRRQVELTNVSLGWGHTSTSKAAAAANEKHSCGQDFPITSPSPPPFLPHSWGIETGVNWGRQASSRPHQRSISPDNSCQRSPAIDVL